MGLNCKRLNIWNYNPFISSSDVDQSGEPSTQQHNSDETSLTEQNGNCDFNSPPEDLERKHLKKLESMKESEA